jgi:hypothetical protein
VFSIPLLSGATAVALVSQALAAAPNSEEEGGAAIFAVTAVWALLAAFLVVRLLIAMWESVSGENDGTPRVAGWLRPQIIVPDTVVTRISQDQLHGVIAHEREHVRAGDPWTNLLQCWLDAIYFFNPAYRLLSRAAREEREYRCDDAAASEVGTLVYLQALLEVAKCATAPRACELRAAGDFERRVARLADLPTPKGGTGELCAACAGFLALILVLPHAASMPAHHLHAASWQARMVPAGQSARQVIVAPLRIVGHALKGVAQ